MIAIRQDRTAVQMTSHQHERLDKAFKELGLKATRKNGVFCSTSRTIAGEWGSSTFIIFIKDGWSGTVFDKCKDTYAFYALKNAGGYGRNEEEKFEDLKDMIKAIAPDNLILLLSSRQ